MDEQDEGRMSAAILTYCGPSKFGRLLQVAEAATFLGISENKLRQIIRRGEVTVARNPQSRRLLGVYEKHLEELRTAWLTESAPRTAAGMGVDARMKTLIKSMGISDR